MLLRGSWGKRFGKDRRFRLVEPIVEDETAALWRARDVFLKQPVTLRLLAAGTGDPGVFQPSLGAVSSKLSHPNIGQVFNYGTHRHWAYVVMEPMDGQTLEARLSAGRIDASEAAAIAADVAEALEAAHRVGVAHGGLRPGTIVLTTAGTVKVIDFGVVPPAGQGATPADASSPAARYRAPEVASGDAPTPTSDSYSVGAVLYHMLTGHFPPESGLSTSSSRKVALSKAEDELGRAAPPSLARICREALGEEDTRPSCADLASQLRPGPAGPAGPAGKEGSEGPADGPPSTPPSPEPPSQGPEARNPEPGTLGPPWRPPWPPCPPRSPQPGGGRFAPPRGDGQEPGKGAAAAFELVDAILRTAEGEVVLAGLPDGDRGSGA